MKGFPPDIVPTVSLYTAKRTIPPRPAANILLQHFFKRLDHGGCLLVVYHLAVNLDI